MGKKLFTKRSTVRIYRPFSRVTSRSKKYGGKYLTITRFLVVCCFALISTKEIVPAAVAESIYKSVMPDGRVMYGEKPQPWAHSVKKSTVSISDTGVKPASKTEIDSINRRAQKRSLLLENTLKTVQTAEGDLRKAEIDREAGIEPLPGERLGIVGRGTRLSEAYWRRQQILEERVDTARQLLKKARQEYNEAR